MNLCLYDSLSLCLILYLFLSLPGANQLLVQFIQIISFRMFIPHNINILYISIFYMYILLSVYLSVYLFFYLSIHIFLSIYLSIYISIYQSIYIHNFLSISIPTNIHKYKSIYILVHFQYIFFNLVYKQFLFLFLYSDL